MATLKSKFEATPKHACAADVLTNQRYLLFAQSAQTSGLQHAATVFRAMADGYSHANGTAGAARTVPDENRTSAGRLAGNRKSQVAPDRAYKVSSRKVL